VLIFNFRELEDENNHLQEEYEKLKTGSGIKGSQNIVPNNNGEVDMVSEAKMLRQHKGRLEARMQILEDHNRQLEAQLQRLRQLLEEVCRTKTNILLIYGTSYFFINDLSHLIFIFIIFKFLMLLMKIKILN
jgi:cell division protein FtsB